MVRSSPAPHGLLTEPHTADAPQVALDGLFLTLGGRCVALDEEAPGSPSRAERRGPHRAPAKIADANKNY